MKKYFSIGEMSKLHNLSIKTLRFYDEKGLLKPEYVNPENGYRYYSYQQFEAINTIRFLKYLGIPLKEIKEYLEVRGKKEYLNLLKKEKIIISQEIETLKAMQISIDRQIEEVELTDEMQLEEITIKELPKRKIIYLDEDITNEEELEIALYTLKNQIKKSTPLIIGSVGLLMAKQKLIEQDFKSFSSVFIFADFALDMKRELENIKTRILKEGKYLCIAYCDNNHSKSSCYYKKIVEYIKDNNYEILGDAVERVIINEYKTNNPKEFLTEIQIPVL